jgi:histidyl-tRNA synthetase
MTQQGPRDERAARPEQAPGGAPGGGQVQGGASTPRGARALKVAQAPKGTYDLLPEAAELRDRVVATAAQVFAAHGYRHIVTPEFEETSLFERGVGEATDIVRKEMYTFADKGGRSLTLRPEGTAPVCRAYIEHGMHKWPQPVKLWYYCPMFRYEKPQAGRYREHWQFGAEAIGSSSPLVDVEIIAMLAELYAQLQLGPLRLLVNSMGDAACRPAYVERLREYLRGRRTELCGDCRERIDLNPLRTFDCKIESCRAVLHEAPRIVDHLCPQCRAHHETVLGLLDHLGFKAEPDFRLVRGLDYYTRTTFEFQSAALGPTQNAVGGGGRYDGLVEELGGPPTPGVGFGCGVERLTLVMAAPPPAAMGPAAYVVSFTQDSRERSFVLAQQLRRQRLAVEVDLAGRSPKGQLKQAARAGARAAVIVGLAELADDTVRLRDLVSGGERDVSVESLAAELRAMGAGRPQTGEAPAALGSPP